MMHLRKTLTTLAMASVIAMTGTAQSAPGTGIGGTGKPATHNGIGGTGKPATGIDGIGGTGKTRNGNDGIGGTGIIGTIVSMASISVYPQKPPSTCSVTASVILRWQPASLSWSRRLKPGNGSPPVESGSSMPSRDLSARSMSLPARSGSSVKPFHCARTRY